MLPVVLALSLLVGAMCDIAVINEAVDELLDSSREVLRAKGQDKIVLPNLDKVIDKKIFGNVVIHGEFHASGGLFQDTTSIKRTGDVTMQTEVGLLYRVNSSESIDVNAVVDKLLESIIKLSIDHNMDEIPVPDIHEEWDESRGIFKLKGCLNCTNGRLRSLTSIHRTGNANLSKQGDHLVLKVLLGFGELELEFDKCQAVVHRLGSITTGLRASVQSNSIDAEITIRISGGDLKSTVNHIYLAEFGKIRIHTGGGLISKIRSRILEIIAKHFRSQIIQILNEWLESYAKKAIVLVNFAVLFR